MPVPVVTCSADVVVSYAAGSRLISLGATATGSPTSWTWTILNIPAGSTADTGVKGDFTNGVATIQNPQLQIDGAIDGTYCIQAVATNGTGPSVPDNVNAQQLIVVRTQNRQLYLPADYAYDWGLRYLDLTLRALETGAPTTHASSHENGGSDEISVAGLSGTLADAQTPTTHASSHENGGGDEISVAGLSGALADDQNADAIRTTSGPTLLAVGAITDGQYLRRSGATVIGGTGGASPLTTKGDLFTYDTGDQRLAVGTNGQVLTADSAEATGVKWATPAVSGGGFDHEDEFTAAASPQETFTLSASATANINTPSGYSVRVFVNGLKHMYGASPGVREFDIVAANQIRVGGLNIGDEVEIIYGV